MLPEMDLLGMKRKQLQALCRKHGLPANATSAKMADSLAAFFEGGGGGTADEEPPPSCSESSELGGRRRGGGGSNSKKKRSTKKVTFFMEGNRVHEFIDLDSDSDEAEPGRQSKGRRQRASIRSGVVGVPNVTTRRQSKAMEIRSPVLKTKMPAAETIVDCGSGDAVPRRITRSLVRGREISAVVEMEKPTIQEGSKKRKNLATRGSEVGGVVKSSARTRSQMQMSKLESEDNKLCETSEEDLKIEMGKSGDQGDVKKRKNEEEAVVTVNNQARTRMQVRRTRSASRDEVCATKLEALKAEASVRSRRGALKNEVVHDQLKTGEGGRHGRSKSRKEVSGDVHCGSGSSIPKGTDAGLQSREILRRSKRNALKTVDSVANITNEQNGKEGQRVKIREKPLEHKPSTSKDSSLVNGEGTMHAEEASVEPQCQHARKSKRHALKSLISSHATGRSSSKKARNSSKSQKKPKNCDVANQNFLETGSISTPNTCSIGKEGSKEQLNESADMGSISKAQGVEKSVDERDEEEQGEFSEVERRETEAGNEVQEDMIKNLAVHPSEDVSKKFAYETNLTPAEPCKVMDICVNIQPSSYDEERVEQFQLSDEADEKLSSKKLVLAENSSSTLEDADSTKEDQGAEFESVGNSVSVCRTIEKEINSPHVGTCFSSLFDNREEDNQLFQKSSNYEEIHGCRLEVLEDKDSCFLQDEHLSRATNVEDFGASFDEVLSTKVSVLSEVDHAIQQQPLDCEKVFFKEKSRGTGIKEGIHNSDKDIVDGCKLENGATPVYEAEDHLQTSVFEKSVPRTSFDIVQGSAEEFEKSVDSLGAFQATKTNMLMGQAAEEPIFYDKLTRGEISAERSDANVDSTGVIASKHENSHMLDGRILHLEENLLIYSKDQGNKMEVKCDMYLEKVGTTESSWTRTCSPKRNMSFSEQENKFALLGENSVFSCSVDSVKLDRKNACDLVNNVSFYGNEKPCKNDHDNITHEFVVNKVESSNENEEESKNNNSPKSMLLCGCEDYREPLNDQNKEDSENNNSLQSMLPPGCKESRKEQGFIQDFDFGDENNISHICEKPLSEENKEDCEDKDFNARDKNDNADAYEERKNLSSLKDENKESSDDINSLQSVLLRGCEASRNENGSAQGINLANENDNSEDYKQPVDDDLISTEEEEVSCQIDRKESIKAWNDENVDQVDLHVGAFVQGNSSTEAPSADFVVSEHEKSSLETICNQEVPLKEITSPVCEDLSLRKEKRKSNMIWCECDFKDESKEDKEDTHEMILELYFDDKSTVGVDTLEVHDYGASEGLGSHRKTAAFELPPSNSPPNNCTGNVEVSNTGTAFSQEFRHEDDEGASAGRTRLEGQHSGKKLKEKIAEIEGHLEEKYDHEEPNVSSAQKDVWVTDNSGKKVTAVRLMEKREENFGYEKECLYAEEIFEMLSAMDSMPTKTNTPAASTEDKVKETRTVHEAVNLETGEFCNAYHRISKEEFYATEQRELDNIIEMEKGGTKEQARKDTESFESTAEDPPSLSNENIPHLQTPVLNTSGEINEVLNASELTGQEDFSLSNENTQCDKGAGSSADDINDEHRAEAGLDGAQFSLAEDKEDLNFKFENCCDPEVSKESILQIDDEDELNIGLMKDTSERNENDMVQIVESDDTLENQGQEHEVTSPLSTRKNGQQSACSEGESIENADRDTLTSEENIDCEAIQHNKFAMQNEELLGNRDDELVERKLISPKETLRQKDHNAEQTNSFGGCEKLSNVLTSRARYKGLKKDSSECSNRSMIHTMENEDSLEKKAQDHESVSPLSTKINEQQESVFSEGESIENANRENISYEVILHSKLDIQNQDGKAVENKPVSPTERLCQDDVIAEQINNFGCKGLSSMPTSHTDSTGLLEGEISTEEHKEANVTEVSEDMNVSPEPGADCNVQEDEETVERQDAQNEEADDIWDSFTKLFEIEEDFDYEAAMEHIEALNLETQLDEVNNLLANMHVSSGRKTGDGAGKARSKTFNPISKLKKWFSTSEMKENSHMKQKPVRKNNSMEKSATPVSTRRPLKQIGNQ